MLAAAFVTKQSVTAGVTEKGRVTECQIVEAVRWCEH